jgi:hypothetical protein
MGLLWDYACMCSKGVAHARGSTLMHWCMIRYLDELWCLFNGIDVVRRWPGLLLVLLTRRMGCLLGHSALCCLGLSLAVCEGWWHLNARTILLLAGRRLFLASFPLCVNVRVVPSEDEGRAATGVSSRVNCCLVLPDPPEWGVPMHCSAAFTSDSRYRLTG